MSRSRCAFPGGTSSSNINRLRFFPPWSYSERIFNRAACRHAVLQDLRERSSFQATLQARLAVGSIPRPSFRHAVSEGISGANLGQLCGPLFPAIFAVPPRARRFAVRHMTISPPFCRRQRPNLEPLGGRPRRHQIEIPRVVAPSELARVPSVQRSISAIPCPPDCNQGDRCRLVQTEEGQIFSDFVRKGWSEPLG